MSSGDDVLRYSGVQSGRIVKLGSHVMIAYDTESNKDCFFRSAAAVAVDLSKLCFVSAKKYGKPLDDSVYICGFEKSLSAGQLIDFSDPIRSVMDCIEQLSTRQLVHSRMVSLFLVTKLLTALVTGQEVSAGAQLPFLPDEISTEESFLS